MRIGNGLKNRTLLSVQFWFQIEDWKRIEKWNLNARSIFITAMMEWRANLSRPFSFSICYDGWKTSGLSILFIFFFTRLIAYSMKTIRTVLMNYLLNRIKFLISSILQKHAEMELTLCIWMQYIPQPVVEVRVSELRSLPHEAELDKVYFFFCFLIIIIEELRCMNVLFNRTHLTEITSRFDHKQKWKNKKCHHSVEITRKRNFWPNYPI